MYWPSLQAVKETPTLVLLLGQRCMSLALGLLCMWLGANGCAFRWFGFCCPGVKDVKGGIQSTKPALPALHHSYRHVHLQLHCA